MCKIIDQVSEGIQQIDSSTPTTVDIPASVISLSKSENDMVNLTKKCNCYIASIKTNLLEQSKMSPMSIVVKYFCTSHLPFNSTLHCHKLIRTKEKRSIICNDSHVSIEDANMTETKEKMNTHNTKRVVAKTNKLNVIFIEVKR